LAVIGQGIGQITQRLLSKSREKKKKKERRESAEVLKGLSVSGDIFYSKFFQVIERLFFFLFFY